MTKQDLVTSYSLTPSLQNDADRQIGQLNKAKTGTAVLVGEDADLLVLLLHHSNHEHRDTFVLGKKDWSKTKTKILSAKKAKQVLDSDVWATILFVHVTGGCETISRISSLGMNLSLIRPLFDRSRQQTDFFFTQAESMRDEGA